MRITNFSKYQIYELTQEAQNILKSLNKYEAFYIRHVRRETDGGNLIEPPYVSVNCFAPEHRVSVVLAELQTEENDTRESIIEKLSNILIRNHQKQEGGFERLLYFKNKGE